MKGSEDAVKVIISIMIYSAVTGVWISGLKIAADKYIPSYNSRLDIWPELCGVLWILLGPAAVAYILTQVYANKTTQKRRKTDEDHS